MIFGTEMLMKRTVKEVRIATQLVFTEGSNDRVLLGLGSSVKIHFFHGDLIVFAEEHAEIELVEQSADLLDGTAGGVR